MVVGIRRCPFDPELGVIQIVADRPGTIDLVIPERDGVVADYLCQERFLALPDVLLGSVGLREKHGTPKRKRCPDEMVENIHVRVRVSGVRSIGAHIFVEGQQSALDFRTLADCPAQMLHIRLFSSRH